MSEQEVQIWQKVAYALEMYSTNIKNHTQSATLANYQKLIDSVWLEVSPFTKNEAFRKESGINLDAVSIECYPELTF